MEEEQNWMWEENLEAVAMQMEWDAAATLQRAFLGHKGRMWAYILRQIRTKDKALAFKLAQQNARDEAMRRELERQERAKLEFRTALYLQRIYRGYRGRVEFNAAMEHKQMTAAGTLVQAVYRGRRGRRNSSGERRVKWTKARVRARRKALGRFMRLIGLRHRAVQRPFLKYLFTLGLDPDSFNLNPAAIMRELKEDAVGSYCCHCSIENRHFCISLGYFPKRYQSGSRGMVRSESQVYSD
jgi:hypothetical protein